MGQRVIGVMYGVNATNQLADFEDVDSLLDQFGEAMSDVIQSEAASREGPAPYAFRAVVPDLEYDCGNVQMLGFWVLCQHGEEKCCDELGGSPIALSAIDDFEAGKRWERFKKWASSRGIKFGKAKLWLMSTEVA